MRNGWWIMGRDLGAYLRSPVSYVILAGFLALDGLFFNIFAVGNTSQLSSTVLEMFFFWTGGFSAAASVFIAMRLIAEERQLGTLTLLTTSTVRDYQLVLGKFLSGLVLLAIFVVLTLYMPVLVYINGKVSLAHLAAGYLGVMLFASAALALALFCSALAPNQLTALVLGAIVVVFFVILWWIAKVANPPVEDLIAYLSLHDKHFRPFMRGLVSVRDIVYYVSLIYVALLGATRVLEARRWS